MHFFSLQYKLTPIRGSKSYIAVMESSGRSLLLTAEALRLLMVVGSRRSKKRRQSINTDQSHLHGSLFDRQMTKTERKKMLRYPLDLNQLFSMMLKKRPDDILY